MVRSALALFALLSLAPPFARAQASPLDAELYPPDFLLTQRETLLLNAPQAEQILALARDAQPRLDALQRQADTASAELATLLRQPQPDPARAQEKVDALLNLERQRRAQHFQLLLAVRAVLTPEQIAAARQLRQPAPQGTPVDLRVALQQRLQQKFELLRTLLKNRPFGGESAPQLVARVEAIQGLARNGQPMQAEEQLDQLIATLQPPKDQR